jgi:hypothetical protein
MDLDNDSNSKSRFLEVFANLGLKLKEDSLVRWGIIRMFFLVGM